MLATSRIRTTGAPSEESLWHAPQSLVYHNNPACRTGNTMKSENVRQGTGGKWLCRECERLNERTDLAREALELRKRTVLAYERELRSALASGEEYLVRRWSRSLREAEERLAWAEADLAACAEKRA
jgi:hypothetical protein